MRSDCTIEFRATVEDQDDDTIYSRFFLDYAADLPGLRSPPPGEDGVDPTTRQTIITIDLNGAALSSSFTQHHYELMIADRPFSTGSETPEGRKLQDDEGLTDSFVWSVELDELTPDCSP